ncbi:MAG: hypothetical protein A2X46_02195 [Lentisphaerae bacterium GWF2_57_35]|nr:MAG: hypothetical protein A2X46_02195 [Lentisphaerae bacterium GWF2_57_35]
MRLFIRWKPASLFSSVEFGSDPGNFWLSAFAEFAFFEIAEDFLGAVDGFRGRKTMRSCFSLMRTLQILKYEDPLPL